MKTLAIETSHVAASIALLDADGPANSTSVVHESALPAGRRTARELAPAIRDALAAAQWKPKDIGLVAATVGPGSFTGLRVGVTTAKAFAYAAGVEVMGVSTLRAVAAQAHGNALETNDAPPQAAPTIVAVIAAERGQFAVGRFRRAVDGRMEAIGEVQLLDADAWTRDVRPDEIVTGPGLAKVKPEMLEAFATTDAGCWNPSAATVGSLAWEDFSNGQRETAMSLAPNYHRKSAAEEKADAAAQPKP